MENEDSHREISLFEKGAEHYATASWLRTAIVGIGGAIGISYPAVPAAIGALDVALTIKAQKVGERRLEALCQAWQDELQEHDLSHIDVEYIKSEEFFDLLIKAWDSTKRTRRDEKIALYAKVLTNALLKRPIDEAPETEGYLPEDYLTVLSEMSYREFCVASAMYMQQREEPAIDELPIRWLERIGACSEYESTMTSYIHGKEPQKYMRTQWERPRGLWKDEDFDALILRLQGLGLVKDLNEALWSEAFVITTSLRKMMAFLEDK